MKYLSQRDPQWAADKLGNTQLTVGRYGCTTTCISMLSDYFGCWNSPADIAARAGWYNNIGQIIWGQLTFKCMAYAGRMRVREDVAIKHALSDPNMAVMLEVNGGAHWVVALHPTLLGNSYIVLDPWTGAKTDVIKTYHDIVGCAFFKRV